MHEGLLGRGRYGWPRTWQRCAQSRIERLLGGSVLGHGQGGGSDTTRAVVSEVEAARCEFYRQLGWMQDADVMTWADSVPGQERHDGAGDAAQMLYERNRHDALTLAGVRAGQLRREGQAAGKSVAAVDGELAAIVRVINQGHGRSDVRAEEEQSEAGNLVSGEWRLGVGQASYWQAEPDVRPDGETESRWTI